MTTVIVANTHFEDELADGGKENLLESMRKNTLSLQLQFLPLLAFSKYNWVAVTDLPPAAYLEHLKNLRWGDRLPQLLLLEETIPFTEGHCTSWGASKQVFDWAKERGMAYVMPSDWEMLAEINSKEFSYHHFPLEGAELIWNAEELTRWLTLAPERKVLKKCFGLSGKGNHLSNASEPSPSLLEFCTKEWAKGRPIICEPWLERCFDFSTQWMIHPNGRVELLGPTVFTTDPKGAYQGTQAGPSKKLLGPYFPFLEEHLEKVTPLLALLYNKGFYGHLGIDAFVYSKNGSHKLRPVVEINARETMSLAALRIQQQWFDSRRITLQLVPLSDSRPSLLPMSIDLEKGNKEFKKKLILI